MTFALVCIAIIVVVAAIAACIAALNTRSAREARLRRYEQRRKEKTQKAGKLGEDEVLQVLGATQPGVRHVFRDFLLDLGKSSKTGKDLTTEIDFILINASGVFVIEVKNWTGDIKADMEEQYWTQFKANGQVNRLYNPFMQNEKHAKNLRTFIPWRAVPIYQLVVFTNPHCVLHGSAEGQVLRLHQLKTAIASKPPGERVYIDRLAQIIESHRSSATKEEHISYVEDIKKSA